MDQNNQNAVWINISRTAWPTLDNIELEAYIIFQKGIDNYEIYRAQNMLILG